MSDMDTGAEASDNGVATMEQTNSAPLDLATVAPVNEERSNFERFLPAEYKGVEWAQNIAKTEKPIFETFKKVDNLEKLMSSRPAIPTAESTPEQVAAYYKALGVPDTVDGYKYEPIKYEEADKEVGAILDKTREGPVMNGMKQVFKQAGLTPKQAQMVIQGFELNAIQHSRDTLIANSQANEALESQMTELGVREFGSREAFDQVTERAGKLTKQVMPPKAHALLARASNESLLLLAYQAEGFRNTYLKQDGRIDSGALATSGAMDEKQTVQAMSAIMATDVYQLAYKPGHQEAVDRVTALRNQLGAINENKRR